MTGLVVPAVVVGLVLAMAGAPVAAQEEFRKAYQHAEELRTAGTVDAAKLRAAYAEAMRRFLLIPADAPNYDGWLPSGAFCAYRAGDVSLAADLFARAIRLGRRDAFNVTHLLRSLWAAERFEDLLRWARELEGEFPGEVRQVLIAERALYSALMVGDRWLRRGDTDAGLWVFAYAVRAGGGQVHDLSNLALAQRHVGRIDDAEESYRRALASAPDDPVLWNDLGLLYKGEGRLEDARRALLRSRELDPTGAAITNLVALAQRQRRPILARPAEELAGVLALRPHKTLARRLLLDELGACASGARPTRARSAGLGSSRRARTTGAPHLRPSTGPGPSRVGVARKSTGSPDRAAQGR